MTKLAQLRTMTTVVADTGDLGAIANLKPTDATTNPSLLLKAAALAQFRDSIIGTLQAPVLCRSMIVSTSLRWRWAQRSTD